MYGSRVFARIPEIERQSKWNDKAELEVLVGYTNNGYRVLINNRVMNARHETVVEENIKLICLERSDDEKDRVNYESEYEIENVENEKYENESDKIKMIANNTDVENAENENMNESQSKCNETL